MVIGYIGESQMHVVLLGQFDSITRLIGIDHILYPAADHILLGREEVEVDILRLVREDRREPFLQRFAHQRITRLRQLSLQLRTQFGTQLHLIVDHHILAAHTQIIIDQSACREA